MEQSLPQKYETICAETQIAQQYKSMPSSRLKAEGLTPIPIYLKNSHNNTHVTSDSDNLKPKAFEDVYISPEQSET